MPQLWRVLHLLEYRYLNLQERHQRKIWTTCVEKLWWVGNWVKKTTSHWLWQWPFTVWTWVSRTELLNRLSNRLGQSEGWRLSPYLWVFVCFLLGESLRISYCIYIVHYVHLDKRLMPLVHPFRFNLSNPIQSGNAKTMKGSRTNRWMKRDLHTPLKYCSKLLRNQE